MADTQANQGGIFAGTVQALRAMRMETLEPSPAELQALAAEITTQIEAEALGRAQTEPRALRELASRPGLMIGQRRRPEPRQAGTGLAADGGA